MIKVITPTVLDAVTLDEVKAELNLESSYTDDDNLLTLKKDVATEWVQEYVKKILLTQTIQVKIEPKGDVGVFIPTPSKSIEAMTLYKDGVSSSLNTANFEIDEFNYPNILKPTFGNEWGENDYVLVTLVAGEDTVSKRIKQAILMHVVDSYDNRSNHEAPIRDDLKILLEAERIPTI